VKEDNMYESWRGKRGQLGFSILQMEL